MKRLCGPAWAVVVLTAMTAACASALPKPLACQNTPQWFANDAHGTPTSAVFVCFGDNHQLLWTSRPLTLDELQKLTAPAAAAPTPKKTHPLLKPNGDAR